MDEAEWVEVVQGAGPETTLTDSPPPELPTSGPVGFHVKEV